MFGLKRTKRRPHEAFTKRWEQALGGAFIVDRAGIVLGFDGRMERLTGWPAVDVVGRPKDMQHPAGSLYDGEIPTGSGARRIELRLHCKDGNTLDVEASIERLYGRGERVAVRALKLLSFSGDSEQTPCVDGRDSLTGLHDRETFDRQVDAAFRAAKKQARPLAVVLADIDHLRRINDQMGRRAGDDILRALARILRSSTDEDGGIARVGEDEFALLLPGSGRGEVRQAAARLRHTVERHRFFGSAHADAPAVTLSLGAATYPADAESGADLMRRAEEALDEARLLGRNRVWCYTRRARVSIEVPIYYDSSEPALAGFTHDLSPSGLFVHTSAPVDEGMRCALAFPLPSHRGKVHVVGRVVRTVSEDDGPQPDGQVPGMGIEFESFGREDRRAIEVYLHGNESRRTPQYQAALGA
jgi:uncharacterized protein (TIGR02266 family)